MKLKMLNLCRILWVESSYMFLKKPNDEDFKGLVKIGDTSIDKPDSNLETNSPYLKKNGRRKNQRI